MNKIMKNLPPDAKKKLNEIDWEVFLAWVISIGFSCWFFGCLGLAILATILYLIFGGK